MLVICSSAKPENLHKILSPILKDAGVKSQVVKPDELSTIEAPDAMLMMGASAFKILVDQKLINGRQKLGSSREKIYKLAGVPTLVTYDPNILNFMPNLREDINWDVRLAVRLALTGDIKPQVGHYEWVPDLARALMWAYQDADQSTLNPMAIDLETVGLDEFHPQGRILTIQISWKIGHSIVYRVPQDGQLPPEVKDQLEHLFSSFPWVNTIGANLKYDMRWMWKHWGIEVKNHKFDTQLVGGLLNENRHNSLKKHIKEYAPELGGYEEPKTGWDMARMDLALANDPEGFLTYAGGDTDGCLRIYYPLKSEIVKDEALAKFYARLLHPASQAFQRLESRGIVIDSTRYAELKVEAEKELVAQSAECFSMMPNRIKYKYADALSLTRDVIITDFLFKDPYGLKLKPTMATPKGMKKDENGEDVIDIPSTAWAHLRNYINHPVAGPFVKKLKEYNATKKTLDTYIVGFMSHIRSDGRFHPSYVLAKGGIAGDEDDEGGTNTGRSSCTSPAYQTWPKRTAWAKRLRSVVICPPGHVIVKLDMSQGELRIMADAANCKLMIEAYHKGLDLHAITAANMMNMTLEQFWALPEDKIEMGRYLAKACIAEDELVLTDKGLVPIQNITSWHLLWDGVEWVSHEGVVFKGIREVITYQGLTATSDHKVFVKEGLIEFGEACGKKKMVIDGLDREAVRIMDSNRDTGSKASRLLSYFVSLSDNRNRKVGSYSNSFKRNVNGTSREAEKIQLRSPYKNFGEQIRRHASEMQQSIVRMVAKLWGSRYTVEIHAGAIHQLHIERTLPFGLQEDSNRPYKQRWKLRSRKSSSCNSGSESKKSKKQPVYPISRYEGKFLRFVAFVKNRLSRVLSWKLENSETSGQRSYRGADISQERKKVYDIINAGPRHRFTVSGKLVSNCNFGLIYSISPQGLRAYAEASYGVVMTESEAVKYHAKWFEPYPEIGKYHEMQKKIAHKFGFVRNQLGRVRHLPSINSFDNELRSQSERQAINAPTQSALFDCMMLGMVEIDNQRPDIWIFGNTHDSLEMYLKEDTWEVDAKQIKQIMENLPLDQFGWSPKVPFIVDFEMSTTTLADLKKVKL